MKSVATGYSIILAGILFGVFGSIFAGWFGLSTLLINGVGDAINVLQMAHVDGIRLAWDIVKVLTAPFVTLIILMGSLVIGFLMCAFGLSIVE